MTRNPTHAKDDRLVTPGEILLEEFLKPAGKSQTGLAMALGVPHRRKRAVTADTDLRLAQYWGLSEGFFMRLQNGCDLRMQRR